MYIYQNNTRRSYFNDYLFPVFSLIIGAFYQFQIPTNSN